MAYYITEACTKCGKCEEECPVSCIKNEDGVFMIDEEACIECGACEGVCTVEAPKIR